MFVYGKQIFHHQTDFIAVNMGVASANVCQSCHSRDVDHFTRSPNHFLVFQTWSYMYYDFIYLFIQSMCVCDI